MRFDKRVTLVKELESQYNPVTGRYDEGVTMKEILPCNVSGVGLERTKELFGEIDAHVSTIRLRHPVKKAVDYVELEGMRYSLLNTSDWRKGVLFVRGDNVE